MTTIRKAAVAGSWYPGTASALATAVDRPLAGATHDVAGGLVARVSPHAGLMYSGPVAAHAYHLLRGRTFDVAVLVGPSHFFDFEGVAMHPSGGFETPYGIMSIDDECASRLRGASTLIVDNEQAHVREHSLEMHLPFLHPLAPNLPIPPLPTANPTTH